MATKGQSRTTNGGRPNREADLEEDDDVGGADATPIRPMMRNKSSGKERKEVQALLERGRVKGYLTFDEVNDALPPEMVTSDQIDDLMGWIGEEEIQVVDSANQAKRAAQAAAARPAKNARKDEGRSSTMPPAPANGEDAYGAKSNDPVRMYLRKMGSVSLLTREGEVEIARRIEEGEDQVFECILNSKVGVAEILDIGDKLKKSKLRVKDVVKDVDKAGEEGEVPEEKMVRFRTLGCYPLTGAVESTANTLPQIVEEMLLTSTSERQGRIIDFDATASMEKKKREGYF